MKVSLLARTLEFSLALPHIPEWPRALEGKYGTQVGPGPNNPASLGWDLGFVF